MASRSGAAAERYLRRASPEQLPLKTGFIGLGAMGLPMARNLHRAGLLHAVWSASIKQSGDPLLFNVLQLPLVVVLLAGLWPFVSLAEVPPLVWALLPATAIARLARSASKKAPYCDRATNTVTRSRSAVTRHPRQRPMRGTLCWSRDAAVIEIPGRCRNAAARSSSSAPS